MLYELSIHEVRTLRTACVLAQAQMVENAESSELCANSRRLSETERAAAARVAKRYQDRAAAFEAVSKALGAGRGITSLEHAKEALER